MNDNPYRSEEGEAVKRRVPLRRLLGWISLTSFVVGTAICIVSQLIAMPRPNEPVGDLVMFGDTVVVLSIDTNGLAFLVGLAIIAISVVAAGLWMFLVAIKRRSRPSR